MKRQSAVRQFSCQDVPERGSFGPILHDALRGRAGQTLATWTMPAFRSYPAIAFLGGTAAASPADQAFCCMANHATNIGIGIAGFKDFRPLDEAGRNLLTRATAQFGYSAHAAIR